MYKSPNFTNTIIEIHIVFSELFFLIQIYRRLYFIALCCIKKKLLCHERQEGRNGWYLHYPTAYLGRRAEIE